MKKLIVASAILCFTLAAPTWAQDEEKKSRKEMKEEEKKKQEAKTKAEEEKKRLEQKERSKIFHLATVATKDPVIEADGEQLRGLLNVGRDFSCPEVKVDGGKLRATLVTEKAGAKVGKADVAKLLKNYPKFKVEKTEEDKETNEKRAKEFEEKDKEAAKAEKEKEKEEREKAKEEKKK
jgi:translation initiation factor 5B